MQRTFFSIGGGFIVEDGEQPDADSAESQTRPVPVSQLPPTCWRRPSANELSISQLMLANECALAPARLGTARRSSWCVEGIDRIWQTMRTCIERGIATEGILPGGLNVRRRAHRLAERLRAQRSERTCPAIRSRRSTG